MLAATNSLARSSAILVPRLHAFFCERERHPRTPPEGDGRGRLERAHVVPAVPRDVEHLHRRIRATVRVRARVSVGVGGWGGSTEARVGDVASGLCAAGWCVAVAHH